MPVVVVTAALVWATRTLVPEPAGSIEVDVHAPWFRWLLIAGPLGYALQWGLFCACVKRLHDVRWSGLAALPVLGDWLKTAVMLSLPLAMMHWHLTTWDLPTLYRDIAEIALGLRIYGLALLIVLAIVPGTRPAAADPDAPGG